MRWAFSYWKSAVSNRPSAISTVEQKRHNYCYKPRNFYINQGYERKARAFFGSFFRGERKNKKTTYFFNPLLFTNFAIRI